MVRARLILPVLLVLALAGAARPAGATEVLFRLPAGSEGLHEFLHPASLSVETAGRDGSTPQDLLAAARADYARMVGTLYGLGLYGGVVSILVDGREAAEIPPFASPQRIGKIEIGVEPGPLFTFSTARIAPLAPGTGVPPAFGSGQPARSTAIESALETAARSWRNAGHAKVAIAGQRITADHRNARLSADITLAPGPRLTFGDLVVANPGNVRPARIRAIAGLPSGQVYDPEEVKKASSRLRRSGAFSSVVLEDAEGVGPGDTLDITARLTDAKPRRFGFGAELSSLEGLKLSGFWLHRNLFGGAERLRVEGEVSGIGGDTGGADYFVSTRFERPAVITPDTDLYLGARVQDLDEPDFSERSARVGGGLTHIFSEDLTGEVGVVYQFSDIDDDIGSRRLQHVLLPAHFTYDTRDDELDATTGMFVDLELTPFVGVDGGGVGGRVYLDMRGYLGLGRDDDLVLAARTQLGSVSGAGLTEVPPGMLFFSGGAGTVRGQPYQSLAVDIGGGRRVGGRSFAALSAEIRAPLGGDWSAVGFADAGFVGAGSAWDSTGNTHAGAGLGVRYDTGLGPIRIDVATPLDGKTGNNIELYVGIGQAF